MKPDTVLYWPHHGEITAGQVAAMLEADTGPSRWEADLRRLEIIATENLCRGPEWAGATQQADAA